MTMRCRHCDKVVHPIRHQFPAGMTIINILLAFMTCGLWAIPAIAMTISYCAMNGPTCPACGSAL